MPVMKMVKAIQQIKRKFSLVVNGNGEVCGYETASACHSSLEQRAERDGLMYAQRVQAYIKAHDGHLYPQSTEGHPLILIGDEAISLDLHRDNPQLAALFIAACGVTHLSLAARMAIARLQADALEEA